MPWKGLEKEPRMLMEARLDPVQGARFQPTGFPDIGAAEYAAPDGTPMLLVESAQSVANRLEAACWDEAAGDLVAPMRGLPYVKVSLPEGRSTTSVLEAHRLNSAYIMDNAKGVDALPALAALKKDPANTRALAKAAFKYDPGSVLHGVFLENIAGGLRLRRLISGFVEARDVKPVDSGGLKADHVDPGGDLGGGSKAGYGHVPFHRREYTAKDIRAFFNLDLAQLRAYGLGEPAERLLVIMALFKVQRFLHEGLRLRTACDLTVVETRTTQPEGWTLPPLQELEKALPAAIQACRKDFANPPVTQLEWTANSGAKAKGKAKGAKVAEPGEVDEPEG